MSKKILTQSQLKEVLKYSPDTGVFTWIKATSSRSCIGYVAGCKCKSTGYIRITVKGRLYSGHALAWLYTTGRFPKDEIDHINHIKDDNRMVNLREVDRKENAKNRRLNSNNKSGTSGVFWLHGRDRWASTININNKCKYLGFYKTLIAATYARHEAEIKYGFHHNHGSKQLNGIT